MVSNSVIIILIDMNAITQHNINAIYCNKQIYRYCISYKPNMRLYAKYIGFIKYMDDVGLNISYDSEKISSKVLAGTYIDQECYHDKVKYLTITRNQCTLYLKGGQDITYDLIYDNWNVVENCITINRYRKTYTLDVFEYIVKICNIVSNMSINSASNSYQCLELCYLLEDIILNIIKDEQFYDNWDDIRYIRKMLNKYNRMGSYDRQNKNSLYYRITSLISDFENEQDVNKQDYLFMGLYKYISIGVWYYPIDKEANESHIFMITKHMLYNKIYFKYNPNDIISSENINKILFQFYIFTKDNLFLDMIRDKISEIETCCNIIQIYNDFKNTSNKIFSVDIFDIDLKQYTNTLFINKIHFDNFYNFMNTLN